MSSILDIYTLYHYIICCVVTYFIISLISLSLRYCWSLRERNTFVRRALSSEVCSKKLDGCIFRLSVDVRCEKLQVTQFITSLKLSLRLLFYLGFLYRAVNLVLIIKLNTVLGKSKKSATYLKRCWNVTWMNVNAVHNNHSRFKYYVLWVTTGDCKNVVEINIVST
jgi:hypothetical protein